MTTFRRQGMTLLTKYASSHDATDSPSKYRSGDMSDKERLSAYKDYHRQPAMGVQKSVLAHGLIAGALGAGAVGGLQYASGERGFRLARNAVGAGLLIGGAHVAAASALNNATRFGKSTRNK